VVPISYRSAGAEVAYLVNDSGATVLIYDDSGIVDPVLADMDAVKAAWHVGEEHLWTPVGPPTDDFLGSTVVTMNYTSGTTGRPKGIERALPEPARESPESPFTQYWGFNADDVHLLCGPAYHTAPGSYAQMHLGEGAAVVMMELFDARDCLALIETEKVTTSHMVPTNFIRILQVDWASFDRSTVREIPHAAAPCPPSEAAHPRSIPAVHSVGVLRHE
jgi:long-chain acyl-CoA synthetase